MVDTLIYRLATLAILLIMLAAIWLGAAPQLHDYAEWIYQSRILVLKLTQPESVSSFEWARYPVPNSLAVALLALVGLIMGPVLAGKAFLTLLLIGWFATLRDFTRSIQAPSSESRLMLILFSLVALSNFFWTGFVSYQLGLLFLTRFLTHYKDNAKPYTYIWFALLIFFSHAMVFLVFVLILLMQLAFTERKSALLPALVVSALLSGCFMLGRKLGGFEPPVAGAVMAGWQEIIVYKLGFPLLLGPFKHLLGPDLRSLLDTLPWLYWAGFGANIVVLAMLAVMCLRILVTSPKSVIDDGKHRAAERTLRLTSWLLLAFYFLAPYNFFGLINPSGRVLIPLLLILLTVTRSTRPSNASLIPQAVAPLTFVFTGLTLLSYLYLMLTAPTPEQLPAPPAPTMPPPNHSVLAYNDWLYAQTRYKYFNYRIFSHANRFVDMEANRYQDLGFDTGPLIGYSASP